MTLIDFLAPISVAEIREAYLLDPAKLGPALQALSNDRTQLRTQFHEHTVDGNQANYFVSLFCNQEPILEEELWRTLCDNKVLRARPSQRGKVAVRMTFFVREVFQRNKLATELLPREEALFKKWGAREVHVSAAESGKWVWTRPRFRYEIQEFHLGLLQEKYKEWMRSRGSTAFAVPSDLGSFPRDFLLDAGVQSISLYKEL